MILQIELGLGGDRKPGSREARKQSPAAGCQFK